MAKSEASLQLLPIRLVAKRGNWNAFLQRKRNLDFQKLAFTVLERDERTCRYCGFRCDKYQEVVNLDFDYRNNHLDNLVTACVFCAQTQFLDGIASQGRKTGVVIYMKEISQVDLNHFARALFCALTKESPYRARLLTIYLSLQERSQLVEQLFGAGSSHPASFGQSLIDCNIDLNIQQEHELMGQLRLLPLRRHFRNQIEYWRQTTLAQMLP